ncbi:cupin domain-containing protein [Candidatus Woesearchaeota archaeon]|nr:cupin domain-containing protein [Candidatus Woesearchaeota archaeon]
MKGRYKWHSHTVDELFYVINGEILIGIKDQPGMKLRAGELAVIPAGVEHCPESSGESRVLMFEKKTNKP